MKRGITFSELLFLALLFAKATQTKLFGHVPSAFLVFSPFILSAIYDILEGYLKRNNVQARIRFYLWKHSLKIKGNKARKTAEKEFKDAYLKGKATANPGQHYDNK